MSYAVFIARLQPLHKAHQKIILSAFNEADKVIVAIGSYRRSPTIRNPWTFQERSAMVYAAIPEILHSRLIVIPLRDFMYSENSWIVSVQNAVTSIVGEDDVKLVGSFKDDSSYYLDCFPQWKLIRHPLYDNMHATDVRHSLFSGTDDWKDMVPGEMLIYLSLFRKKTLDAESATRYENLVKEFEFIENYKKQWDGAPFPPVFVTTDAVVIQSGHVLLVKRKFNPGKGMYALPGGFISQTQSIFDSAIRELYEETAIMVPKEIIRRSCADSRVFDHPKRSLRGRTVTHAYFFNLDEAKSLPHVKGEDDAESALWMPIGELALHEESFFEDHLYIIQHFVNRA